MEKSFYENVWNLLHEHLGNDLLSKAESEALAGKIVYLAKKSLPDFKIDDPNAKEFVDQYDYGWADGWDAAIHEMIKQLDIYHKE